MRLIQIAFAAILLPAAVMYGAEQEIGLTLGGLVTPDRSFNGGTLGFSTGTALQVNYARRFASLHFADVLGEVHFLASPQQQISSANSLATKDIAVLYLTPGIRLKFLPGKRLSPWVAAGGGYSLYEQSTTTIAGTPNGAPRHTSGGALQLGGGADFKILPYVSVRAEVREFYTGSPKFNIPVDGSGQSNVVAGGGIVLRFGR